jgi:hypothetical protein
MDARFSANQSVEITVPDLARPIAEYLRQGDRIVAAMVGNGEMTVVGADVFQLKLRPIGLLSLSLQPIVNVRVWTTDDDVLHVESVDYQILGLEAFGNPRFELRLEGELYPRRVRQEVRLQGQVDLLVCVDVPRPLSLTPRGMIERAGNAVMAGVLGTMKQQLLKNLVADYQGWVRQGKTVMS